MNFIWYLCLVAEAAARSIWRGPPQTTSRASVAGIAKPPQEASEKAPAGLLTFSRSSRHPKAAQLHRHWLRLAVESRAFAAKDASNNRRWTCCSNRRRRTAEVRQLVTEAG